MTSLVYPFTLRVTGIINLKFKENNSIDKVAQASKFANNGVQVRNALDSRTFPSFLRRAGPSFFRVPPQALNYVSAGPRDCVNKIN